MNDLFTNVAPMRIPKEKTVRSNIKKCISQSDKVEIAVGYFSKESLARLDEWVHQFNIKNVTLIGGMYSVSGIPASVYNEIIDVNKKWQKEKIGEILLVNNMNYHGKLYTFWQKNHIFKSIIGSANLSVIAPSTSTFRQYELATYIINRSDNLELEKHLSKLITFTTPASQISKNFKKVHESIALLQGIEGVRTLTDSTVRKYEESEDGDILRIPIKAPHFNDRFKDNDRKCYTHSNINVCYGSGRKGPNGKRQPRSWFEVQITCDRSIIHLRDYPKTKKPFYIVTDDNYMFEAHTTSANHKQLSAYGSDRVLGRWIKGRLVTAGLLTPYDHVKKDKNRNGMVTYEMLDRSGMRVLELHKTGLQELGKVYEINKKGRLDKTKAPKIEPLDVWFATFSNNMGDK